MAYSTTSKYVQLTPYLLMEYMYADTPNPETYPVNSGSTTVAFDKLVNGYENNYNQIFNPNQDYAITKNTPDNSVVKVDINSFVTLDSNLIIPFNDFTDLLTNSSNLPITFPSNISVVYDSVRYHLVAGYNLSNLDGIICSIQFLDANATYVTFSQILLQKGTAQEYTYNPNPLKIGSQIYDKYFEIKVPSLKDMMEKYLATGSSLKNQTLAYLTSNSTLGYVVGSPMRIEVWEVKNTTTLNGYEKYNAENIAVLSLESEDPFSNIGARIQESDRGEFFEYFATDNMGFIEDFILFQNSIGNAYYINHQIDTLEQIGVALIQTNTFQSIQTTAYDTPNYYRPIIKNSSIAASFTLRYTMSLVNSTNQSRVIRIGTYTSTNPSQWGFKITPISLSVFPQSQKIYNRIYQQPNIITSSYNPSASQVVRYSNVFIQQNEVSSVSVPLLIRNGVISENPAAEVSTAQPSGRLTISISPFDNYYKFSIYKNGANGNVVKVDLGDTSNYKIAFLDNAGRKFYIPSLQDKSLAKSQEGEIAFKVDEFSADRIIQFNDKRFFITTGGENTVPQQTLGSSLQQVSISGNARQKASVVLQENTPAVEGANYFNTQIKASQPNSVVYWGFWKRDGAETIVQPLPATGASPGLTAAPIPRSAAAAVDLEETPNNQGSFLYTIQPAAGATAAEQLAQISPATTVQTTPTTTKLSEAEITSSLNSQIPAFVNQGWTDLQIINYFLTPGQVGYKTLPGITKDLFIRVAGAYIDVSSLTGGGTNIVTE